MTEQQASYEGHAVGRMVDIAIAADKQDIQLIPPALPAFLPGHGKRGGGGSFRGYGRMCHYVQRGKEKVDIGNVALLLYIFRNCPDAISLKLHFFIKCG